MPSASALCQFRKKVSYLFFKESLEKLLNHGEQYAATLGGLRIYAVDGQQWILPRTEELVENGFSGRAVANYKETYMPRGYLTHLYDSLTGLTKDFTFNPTLNEHADARHLLKKVESNALVVYDRLFFSYKLMNDHFEAENYFLIRCKSNANAAVKKIFDDKDLCKYSFTKGVKKRVYLFKVKNPSPKNEEEKWLVFATNLPKSWHDPELIRDLYLSRWEVETSFKELTATTKGEQWHSKTYNGIMQELYAKFWLINFTKLNMLMAGQKPNNPLEEIYFKPNFKVIFNYVLSNLGGLWRQLQYLPGKISPLLKKTTEKRKRCSRSYERIIKSPRSPYKYLETGWYSPPLTSLSP